MDTKFNVFEMLQIAEKVEHNGGKYYLAVADKFQDSTMRDFCYSLAGWKGRHERILIRRRKRYSEKTGQFGRFDPDNYVLSNPQTMAALAVTTAKGKSYSLRELTGREGRTEILKNAIRREKEAITFYRGLKEFAQDPTSQLAIDVIIAEVLRYIAVLTESLKQSENSNSLDPAYHRALSG